MVVRVVIVALLLVASSALANPKTAAVHDRQGKAYFEAKQYDAAIDEFKKSYALVGKPLTLFKIASAYYAKGDYENAIAFYQQYLQADPEGPYAKQALEFTTIAKRALDDKRAQEAAAREAEDAKRAAAEREQQQLAAATRVKNAEAFARAGAWGSAGDEYRAAHEIDGEPSHLLAAAEAYRQQPDHAKARDAYRAYLDKVPLDARSDEVRGKLAETVRVLEMEEAKRVAASAERQPLDDVLQPKRPAAIRRGWSSFGGRIGGGISQPTNNPIHMESDNGLVAKPSFEVGAFARYQLTTLLAVRPELSFVYRTAAFDGQMNTMGGVVIDALVVTRAGLQLALPLYVTLGTDGDGFRIGGGPWIGLMPYVGTEVKPGFPNGGDRETFDVGAFGAIEYDFGLLSIEFRLGRALHQMTADIEATAWVASIGATIGYDVAP